MTRFSHFLFAAFAVSFAMHVSAQTISVRTLAFRSGEIPEVYLKGPEQYLSLEFSAVQPSEPVRAVAVDQLVLYASEINDKGEQVFAPVQKLKIPPGSSGILLLAWANGEKMRYVAIKDNFESARYNDWLLINAATRPVAFKVGENTKAMVVAPGKSTTHRISAKAGKGATVLAQAPFDGKAKTFFSTYWPVHPGKRCVVLFVDDGPKIRVKRISDRLATHGD